MDPSHSHITHPISSALPDHISSIHLSDHHHVSQERYGVLSPLGSAVLTDSDAFPASAAFDVINQVLQSDEASRKEAINTAKAVVAFTLKNADGKEESWHLDLKENGAVGKGAAPQGGKADGTSYILLRFLDIVC